MAQIADLFATIRLQGEGAFTTGIEQAKSNFKKLQEATAKGIKPKLDASKLEAPKVEAPKLDTSKLAQPVKLPLALGGLEGIKEKLSGLGAALKVPFSFVTGKATSQVAAIKKKLEDKVMLTFGEKKKPDTAKLTPKELETHLRKEDLNKAFSGMGKTIKEFADKAKVAFAAISSGILGSVAMGDSRTFQEFQVALDILGREIGVVLSPIVRELTGYIMGVAEWFGKLSPEAQKQVVWWAKVGLVLTGVVMIMPKVISAIQLFASTMQALGPIGIAAAAAFALTAAYMKKATDAQDKHVDESMRKIRGELTPQELNSDIAKKVKQGKTPEEQLQIARAEAARTAKEAKEQMDLANKRYGQANKYDSTLQGLSKLPSLVGLGEGNSALSLDELLHNATGKSLYYGDTKEKQEKAALAAGIVKKLEAGQALEPKKDKGKDGKDKGKEGKEGEGKTPAQKALENYVYDNRKPTQLLGIVDAWRKAMQSNIETPELRYQRLMLEQLRRIAEKEQQPVEIRQGAAQ